MNNTVESIMAFINENTTLLICICLFLIVILVIYLIETSIKSKKISKRIEEENKITEKLVEKHNDEIEKETVLAEDLETPKEVVQESNVIEDKNETNIFNEIKKEEVKEPKEIDVIYKNNKKLSEILFDEIEKQPSGKLDDSIVKKEEIIKENSSTKELDEIMKKLNNYK
jgi:hypothetical protein